MTSYTAIIALLFACILAFSWAAPVEDETASDTSVATLSAQEQAVRDWYGAVYQQYSQPALVARDGVPIRVAPWAPPYPPPPTFPPYPPPPTFPPYPPPPSYPPGGRRW